MDVDENMTTLLFRNNDESSSNVTRYLRNDLSERSAGLDTNRLRRSSNTIELECKVMQSASAAMA